MRTRMHASLKIGGLTAGLYQAMFNTEISSLLNSVLLFVRFVCVCLTNITHV